MNYEEVMKLANKVLLSNFFNEGKFDPQLKADLKITGPFLLAVGRFAEKKGFKYLIDAMQIDKLFAVTGASMGAMQVLQWVIDYPEKVLNVIHYLI